MFGIKPRQNAITNVTSSNSTLMRVALCHRLWTSYLRWVKIRRKGIINYIVGEILAITKLSYSQAAFNLRITNKNLILIFNF